MSKNSRRIGLNSVHIDGGFWKNRQDLIADVVLPFQEAILNDEVDDAPKSHAIMNFRIAAGEAEGNFEGLPFQDSDVAKWIEAASYILTARDDPALESRIDEVIRLIGAAQEEDGYLDTFYTLCHLPRWSNIREHHELYIAGHMMEAAVAYYKATGKDSLLKIMERNADLLCDTFGKDLRRGYPGHPEAELALLRLYRATGKKKYRDLAEYFVNERGTEPEVFQTEIDSWGPVDPDELYFAEAVSQKTLAKIRWQETGGNVYVQAHAPVRNQTKAAGHAVRALYLYTAMADLASETGDRTLLDACHVLWRDIVDAQIYVTGGLGATATGEAFGVDYELPNDTAYAETCASVAMVFFASRMLENEIDGEYTDIIEREIYNGAISGMNLDGKGFFYVNPLETVPEISGSFPDYKHVATKRFKWHICACCPPNLARMIASIGQYAYGQSDDTVFVHLYMDSTASFDISEGVELTMRSGYPWDGDSKVRISCKSGSRFDLALHIPAWCHNYEITLNGEPVSCRIEKGYAYISRNWNDGDEISLKMELVVRRIYADTRVRADAGCVAIARGAVVYCAEGVDNDGELSELRIPRDAVIHEEAEPQNGALGRIVSLTIDGARAVRRGSLYSEEPPAVIPEKIKMIPYYAWANRGDNGMRVWLLEN